MTERTKRTLAGLAAIAVTVLVVGMVGRHDSGAGTTDPSTEPRRFRLTAVLTPNGVARPVGHPRGVSFGAEGEVLSGPRGRLTATFDRDYRREGGHALQLRLTTSELTPSPIAAHIHLGDPHDTGREVVTLCRGNDDSVPSCRALAGGVFLWWGAWMLDPVLRGPTYVDVHTTPDGQPALRGAIRVEPLPEGS